MAICRDCKHYDLEAFRIANGKLRIVKDKHARCLFDPAPIVRKIPNSVSGRDYLGTKTAQNYNLTPGRMSPDAGSGCPQWTQRPPASEGDA